MKKPILVYLNLANLLLLMVFIIHSSYQIWQILQHVTLGLAAFHGRGGCSTCAGSRPTLPFDSSDYKLLSPLTTSDHVDVLIMG